MTPMLLRTDEDRIRYYCRNHWLLRMLDRHAFRDPQLEEMARIAHGFQDSYTPTTITQVFATGTFTPPAIGNWWLKALGAGASGGSGASSIGNLVVATGGAGGGSGLGAESFQPLVGGTGYSVTIGAGGAAATTATGGSHNGTTGNPGGDTIVAGVTTFHAPGGGGGQGGCLLTTITSVSLVGNVLTLTLANALNFGNSIPGEAIIVIGGATGGTWGSAGTSGAGINGAWIVKNVTGTTIDCLYTNGGVVPTGVYTASSAQGVSFTISGGVAGANAFSVNSNLWAPGYGGPIVCLATNTIVPNPGVEGTGLASGGGGAGGASAVAANGGTGGGAGTAAAGGAGGSNGASGSTSGTAGGSGAANSGAGGGGGGAANGSTGNAAASGAGGSGLFVAIGPF